MRKIFYFVLIAWLVCLTLTMRYQAEALRIHNFLLYNQENDIRDLQEKVEPKTHFNQHGPYNNLEPGPVQEY